MTTAPLTDLDRERRAAQRDDLLADAEALRERWLRYQSTWGEPTNDDVLEVEQCLRTLWER